MSAVVRDSEQAVGGPFQLPYRFGPYILFDHVGSGGMADLYLALSRAGLGGARRVVVKLVRQELRAQAVLAELLVQEAKLASRLNHRNIVQVFELGRVDERTYIAMEYVEGYDLNRLLRRLSALRIPLPTEFALFIVCELLAALEVAHRAVDEQGQPFGLVHRDISPSNVLVSFEGEVALCDFGIARATLDDTDSLGEACMAATNVLAGKSGYMAPEHARDRGVDARSDLFSVGILLWELCSGRRMRRGNEAELLAIAQAGEVPPLPDRGLPQHGRLQALIGKATAHDPALRFQTAGDMLAAIERYAMSTALMASELRFGKWLSDNFAEEIIAVRLSRQLGAERLATEQQLDMPALRLASAQADGDWPAVQWEPELSEGGLSSLHAGSHSAFGFRQSGREADASAVRPRGSVPFQAQGQVASPDPALEVGAGGVTHAAARSMAPGPAVGPGSSPLAGPPAYIVKRDSSLPRGLIWFAFGVITLLATLLATGQL